MTIIHIEIEGGAFFWLSGTLKIIIICMHAAQGKHHIKLGVTMLLLQAKNFLCYKSSTVSKIPVMHHGFTIQFISKIVKSFFPVNMKDVC